MRWSKVEVAQRAESRPIGNFYTDKNPPERKDNPMDKPVVLGEG